MAILIVDTTGQGAEFFDIGYLDPSLLDRLLQRVGGNPQRKVSGHVIDGDWFGIEPKPLGDLFEIPELSSVDPFLEAPRELRAALVDAWLSKVNSMGGPAGTKQGNRLSKVAALIRAGKPDRFTLIDEW